jgi:hypothetical protein
MQKRILRVGLIILIALLGALGAWYGYTHRPLPSSVHTTLFEGITYTRDVRTSPRPLVIHVVTVDLDAPGIRFLVTPGDPHQERPLPARKTSQFLDEFDVQVAINGDFFTPWHSNSPWDYYPHVSDPVSVRGFASSRGVVYSTDWPGVPTLYISKDSRASFQRPQEPVFNAISGDRMLLEGGDAVCLSEAQRNPGTLHPRTVVALDADGKTLILVVVDGRQPNYSEGVTLAELSAIVREYGGYDALNLDGGGSATLVVEGSADEPVVLNSPIDNRIPGRERPVAYHLGVYARENGAGGEHRTED